jgi:hypothetical protein
VKKSGFPFYGFVPVKETARAEKFNFFLFHLFTFSLFHFKACE